MTRRRRVGRDESGLTSVEWALVMPVVVLLIMSAVQVALWAHAAHVATAAAEEGLVAARAAGGSAQAGEHEGHQHEHDRQAGQLGADASGLAPPAPPHRSSSATKRSTTDAACPWTGNRSPGMTTVE